MLEGKSHGHAQNPYRVSEGKPSQYLAHHAQSAHPHGIFLVLHSFFIYILIFLHTGIKCLSPWISDVDQQFVFTYSPPWIDNETRHVEKCNQTPSAS